MVYFTKGRGFFVAYATEEEMDLRDEQIIEKVAALYELEVDSLEVFDKKEFSDLAPQEYDWIIEHPNARLKLMEPPKEENGFSLNENYEGEGYVSSELKVFIVIPKERNAE